MEEKQQHTVSELMKETMEKVRLMADANTVMGQPIVTGEVTLIPISRVSVGVGVGGSDFVSKNQKTDSANCFGGGLNTMAGGVGQISVAATSAVYRANIPALAGLGGTSLPIGSLFFSYGFMVYLAIALAIAMSWFLNRTRKGLNLRAVGENPATADAAGINVTRYQYLATCIGAGISGMGGLYYTMDYIKGTWANDSTIEALGWLAVALVIFATWRPMNAIWGAYLFGGLTWLYFYVPNLTRSSQELFKMLPYLVTIAVLILISMRKKRENQPPAHLGLPYFREER